MKFRISPAAAAVILAAGFFTGGLRAASAPAAIPFENDAAFNVTLSTPTQARLLSTENYHKHQRTIRCLRPEHDR
jgi:conjugal transfer pilus assembly protein TraK